MKRTQTTFSGSSIALAMGMRALSAALLLVAFSGCVSTGKNAVAISPASHCLGNKHVRVSLANRAVYVYDESGKAVFSGAVAIGKRESPTPTGEFKAFNKLPRKRSGSYGFHVNENSITPGKRSNLPKGSRYVGYPMPYWVEFKSGYGFHAGSVWPTPRSHGCLRLHKTVAKQFFDLVDAGTPIFIAHSLPEDRNAIGKNIWRPTDYAAPNSPNAVLISNAPFSSSPHVHF